MEIEKSLNFAFEDEKWASKLGIGALISMVPFLNLAWTGYTVEIMRRVVAGHKEPLSDWDDLGGRWIDGLYLALAGLVYSLPGIFLIGLPVGVLVIPAVIQDADMQGIIAVFTTLTGLLLFAGAFLYFLIFSFIFPAVQLSYSQTRTFRSCFDLRQIFRWIKSDFGDYLVAWITVLAVGIVVSILVGIAALLIAWVPCLGQVLQWAISMIAAAWVAAFGAHLFGQFGKKVIPQESFTPVDPEIV